jgi:hypothetical protein
LNSVLRCLLLAGPRNEGFSGLANDWVWTSMRVTANYCCWMQQRGRLSWETEGTGGCLW